MFIAVWSDANSAYISGKKNTKENAQTTKIETSRLTQVLTSILKVIIIKIE